MSDRCNKCRYYSPLHYCKEHNKDAHARDHACREFKPKKPEEEQECET